MIKSVIRNTRLIFAFTLISISGIALSGHILGRVYQGPLIFFFIAFCFIASATIYNQNIYAIIGSTLLLSISYRLAAMFVPGTRVGIDTQGIIRDMRAVMDVGRTSAIHSGFYSEAPLFDLFGAIASTIMGVDPTIGLFIYPIAAGIVVPLVALLFVRSIGVNDLRLLGLSIVLAAGTTEAIRRSYYPIAQTQATVYWWIFLLIFLRYIHRPTARLYVLLTILIGAMVLSHKLPIIVVAIVLFVLIILYQLDRFRWNNIHEFTPISQAGSLFVICSVVVILQWLYVGPLIVAVISRLATLRTSIETVFSPAGSGSESFDPNAAVQARPGWLGEYLTYSTDYILYFERIHAIVLLIFSGIAWATLYFFSGRGKQRTNLQVLLAASTVCVILVIMGQVAVSGVNPTRPLLLIEPVLVTLIIGLIYFLARQVENVPERIYSIALVVFVVLILTSQVFSASAAPAYENNPRYYADQSEVAALDSMVSYTDEPLHTDRQHIISYKIYNRGENINSIAYKATDPLFNANMSKIEEGMIVYRHDVDVYQGKQTRWRLTWDPANQLSSNQHKVYDNDAVTIYT